MFKFPASLWILSGTALAGLALIWVVSHFYLVDQAPDLEATKVLVPSVVTSRQPALDEKSPSNNTNNYTSAVTQPKAVTSPIPFAPTPQQLIGKPSLLEAVEEAKKASKEKAESARLSPFGTAR